MNTMTDAVPETCLGASSLPTSALCRKLFLSDPE